MHIEHAHMASAMIATTAGQAFAFLCRIENFRRWSLGCLETEETADGCWRGRSLFDGSTTFCRLETDGKRLAIDFHVGSAADSLLPRNQARIFPGPVLGASPQRCLLTMTALRPVTMDEERWKQLQSTHECEIRLIKGQMESEASNRDSHRPAPG